MSNYFKQIPNFDYVSRLPDAKISDYITVKNLFKRGKLADDIFQDITVFTKYEIKGDDRPDNVAYKVYDDPDLDWVILFTNNIINIQSEWPMPQRDFDRYLLDKYETYEKLNEIHHYETLECKNTVGAVVVPKGLWVESDYSVTYYDWYAGAEITKSSSDIVVSVTNYEYEDEKENEKRNIYILKPRYLNIIKDDLKEMMQYKEGSTQYLDKTLKIAENIRLYQ
ncbi:MAG: baseplate wedge protein 53 [Pseudomonadota bacterium]|nr:baseplate wedge protein 53 [Pseudomonadota bacterium]